jgi:hypothetical protein
MKTNQSPANFQDSYPGSRRASVRGRVIRALEYLFIFVLLFAFARDASGDPMGAEQASNAVTGWLRAGPSPLQMKLGQQVKRVQTFNDPQGTPLYHVVYLDPDGFVIVAADDLIEPIIGFASGGQFDPSTENPLGALVSRDLPERIARVKGVPAAKAQGRLLAAKNKWGQLKNVGPGGAGIKLDVPNVSDVRVAPLTQTTWNQATVAGGNACYNYYTPPNAAGSAANDVCGCVATAMSQLMRFWQCPVNGVGTAAFTIYVTDVAQSRNLRGGNGSGGPYDWNNMVLSPNGSSTTSQLQAIGALCADAGVSVNMQYDMGGSGSSGAYLEDVPGSLVNTFGYANAVCGDNGAANIGTGLIDMVNPNLDAGCPVLLGINDGYDGHAIVCDGYGYNLSTLYHHLNLGWSGSYTAWYNLPDIDAGGYAFDSVDSCVYNVWTNGTGEIISGRVTDGAGTPVAGAALTAARAGGGTYTATSDTRGIYALAKIPASSTYTVSASKTGYVFTNQIVVTGQSVNYSATSGNRWAINFMQSDSDNPTGFSATPAGSSSINLSWGKNPSGDNVMVAGNTNPTFGTPSGTYSVGDPIAGGGTVLYSGNATASAHTGLSGGTTCYYKAWSIRSGPGYSSGLMCSATTPHDLQFTEGFENGGSIPGGWSQEYVAGSVSWVFQSGDSYGHPVSAHGGNYNAVLFYAGYGDYRTRLVTPAINFGTATRNAQLTFWHYMEEWSSDQDQLRVYYKTSAGGAWTLLASYTSSLASWTQQTISLPNPNSTYYLAFEGADSYGFGVCIDDVAITADAPTLATPRIHLVLSGTNLVLNCANGTVLGTYCVLASTNLTAPWTNWPVVATNTFDLIGCSRFTNGVGPNFPQRFYLIRYQ